jgi:polyisoprenoid-binding protein YceI
MLLQQITTNSEATTMRNYILSTFFIIGMISTACNYATADSGVSSWFLPLTLSDKNTTIAFTLDSTWHTVQGTTSGVSGLAELQDGEDPTSLHVQVQIPVETFDTDNSMRDSKLRKIMTADKFKTLHSCSRYAKRYVQRCS